jgi:hypothetical protein
MSLESQLNEIVSGLSPDEVIPVLTAYIAGMGVYENLDPEKLADFVGSVIRETYKINTAPSLKERN